MGVTDVIASIAVTDLELSSAWYERLFGRSADDFPMAGLAEWRMTGSASVQLVQDPARAGNTAVALGVTHIEEHVAGIEQRGLTTGPIDPVAERARTASIDDPDGNTITFAEAVGPKD